jgi:hypothetical protein
VGPARVQGSGRRHWMPRGASIPSRCPDYCRRSITRSVSPPSVRLLLAFRPEHTVAPARAYCRASSAGRAGAWVCLVAATSLRARFRSSSFLLPLDRKSNAVLLVFLIRRNAGDPFAIGGLCEAILRSLFVLVLFLYRGQSAALYDNWIEPGEATRAHGPLDSPTLTDV